MISLTTRIECYPLKLFNPISVVFEKAESQHYGFSTRSSMSYIHYDVQPVPDEEDDHHQ